MSKGYEKAKNIYQSASEESRSENKDWNSYFNELKDSDFKKFSINNSKEKRYLQKS